MDTTKIKDGLILLVIAGLAVGGFIVARRVISSVESAGNAISSAASAVIEPIKAAAATVGAGVSTTLENHGTVAPPSAAYVPRYPQESDTDYQFRMYQLSLLAAGGMGA